MKQRLFILALTALGCTLNMQASPKGVSPAVSLDENFDQELPADWSVGSKWKYRSDEGVDGSGCYAVQEAISSSALTTPVVIVDKTGYRLAYSQKGNSAFSYEDWTVYDEFYIDYAVDGGDFIELKKLKDSFNKYTNDTLSLPVDSGSSVQIRFRYEHLETPYGYETNGERFIDNVAIGTFIEEPEESIVPDPVPLPTELTCSFDSISQTSNWKMGEGWTWEVSDGVDNSGCMMIDNEMQSTTLTAPTVDISAGNYILKFSHKGNCSHDDENWVDNDEFYVEYALDGGEYTSLKSVKDASSFASDSIDLSHLEGDSLSIRFNYVFNQAPYGWDANGKHIIDNFSLAQAEEEVVEPVIPDPVPLPTELTCSFDSISQTSNWKMGEGWTWEVSDGVDNSGCMMIDNEMQSATLTAPTVDISAGNYVLKFSHKGNCSHDDENWVDNDEFYVEYALDGGEYNSLKSVKDASSFASDSIDLSHLEGDSLSIRFNYVFNQTPYGWDSNGKHIIDNFSLAQAEEEVVEPVIPDPVPLPTELTCSFDSISQTSDWKMGEGWSWEASDGVDNSGCMMIDNEMQSATLTAPTVDISAGNYILKFSHKGNCSHDDENWVDNDEFYVEYALDGGEYTSLKSVKDASSFASDSIDLSHLEGDSLSIRFNYVFNQAPYGWDSNGKHIIDNFSLAQAEEEVVEPVIPENNVEEQFDEDLSGEKGWDVQEGWAFTADQGVNNSGCMAIVQPFESASMTTPIIKVEGDEYTVRFDQKGFSMAEGWDEYDRFFVEYALDGGEFITLAQLDDQSEFKNESFTISTEGASELQIRFRFEVIDQASSPSRNTVQSGERYIDNVTIKPEITVGMSHHEIDNVLISVAQNSVTLHSTKAIEEVSYYDMKGQMIGHITSGEKEVNFTLPQTGVYVVRYVVEGHTFIEKIMSK